MIKNLRLCFKIDKSVRVNLDNSKDSYICYMARNVDKYNYPAKEYNDLVEAVREKLAEQIKCSIDLITPVTLNEYLDNLEI